MSGIADQVTLHCGRCEFSTTGEPNDAKLAIRQHGLIHDVEDDVTEMLAAKAKEEQKPDRAEAERLSRTIASAVPVNGKTNEQLDEEYRETVLAQLITVRCADCVWEATGPQGDVRREWGEHRRDEHGDDRALASVEASLGRVGRRRRTAGGKLAMQSGKQTVAENMQKTRASGGGHGFDGEKAKRGLCKRAGCEEDSLGQKMGPYAGLCETHTVEARGVRSAALTGKPRGGRSSGSSPSPEEPKPEVAPPPTSEPVPAPSLIALAQAVEEADEAYGDAIAAQEQAEERFQEAVKALRERLDFLAGAA